MISIRDKNMVYYGIYYKSKEDTKMKNKDLLMKELERMQKYCDHCNIGTEEYDDAFDKLMRLRKELAELEKNEAEIDRKNRELADAKKDRRVKNVLEGVKIVGTGIVMPCIGYVVVTAFEKDDSFTSSLKRVVDCFVPKGIK